MLAVPDEIYIVVVVVVDGESVEYTLRIVAVVVRRLKVRTFESLHEGKWHLLAERLPI